MGRDRASSGRRLVGLLSRIGVAGSVPSAALSALLAATGTDSGADEFFGPKRTAGGPPARLEFWAPLQKLDDAKRLWEVSESLVGVRAP